MIKKFLTKRNARSLFFFVSCMLVLPSLLSFSNQLTDTSETKVDNSEATQYIGYGYNIAGGRRLAENDSLQLNNPILDIDNKELMSKVKVFNSSKTVYESNSSSKVSEITKKYGQVVSGGANVGAQIYCVNVNVGSTFNTTKNSSWTTTQHEEYSYYTIFVKNKPVVLQMDAFEIKNYLNPTFEKEIKSIKSASEALNLLMKYGTHLPTGYTLGGMFELTNYYASNSSSYVRESSSTFASQVSTTIGSYASAGVDFSFNESFGGKDNNSYAVNNYKCTTYGGYTFPGLTIDQAFSYYETAFGAGYVYDIWTDSINAGKNLVIVDIPQSSEMIPLWDLLPADESYSNTRNLLIESYLTLCGNQYKEFKDIYQDVVATDVENGRNELDSSISTSTNYTGYNMIVSSGQISKEISVEDELEDTIVIKQGNTFNLNYYTNNYEGHVVEWISDNKSVVQVQDARNAVFKTVGSGQAKLTLTVDGAIQPKIVKNVNVNSSSSTFNIGDGSEENPYLIFSLSDLNKLAASSADLTKNYRLMADITDGTNSEVQQIAASSPFKGVFDGYGHTIKITNSTRTNSIQNSANKNMGLFAENAGTIKNLIVEDCDFSFDADYTAQEVQNFGIICGSNTGTIIGCVVNNSKIDFYTSLVYAYRNINIGGIAGYNTGTISNCEFNEGMLNNIAEDDALSYKESIRMAYTGGIVGLNKSGNINYCSTKKCVIDTKIGETVSTTSYLFLAASGGIVGASIDNGTIEHCLVYDYSKLNKTFDTVQTISAQTYDDGHYSNSVAGGIAGYVSYNSDNYAISYCLVRNVGNIKVTVGSSSTYNDRSHCGYLAGVITKKYPFSADTAASSSDEGFLKTSNLESEKAVQYIYDSYVQASEEGNLSGGTADESLINSKSNYTSTIKLWSSGTVNELSSNFTTDEQFYDSNTGDTLLKIKTYDFSTNGIFVDLQKAKTEFYVGDTFTTGNIKVYGSYTVGGDIFDINYYTIDSREFIVDSTGKASTPGKATIRILVNNAEVASYIVTINNPEVVEFYAVDSRTEGDSKFYEGDSYISVLKKTNIKTIKANGEQSDISYTDLDDCKVGITGVSSFENKKLEAGNNDIVLHYNDLIYVYHVYAEKREVTDIIIQNKETLESKTYNLGIKSIDFGEDLKIYAYYDRLPIGETSSELRIPNGSGTYIPDGNNDRLVSGVFTLKDDEYELTYSKIVKGKNKITATYDLSVSDSFIVVGNQFVTKKTVNDFIDAVNEINSSDNLIKRFNAIQKANKMLTEIGDYTCLEIVDADDSCVGILGDDGSFMTAKNRLDQEISKYNDEVNHVNGKLFDAVKVSNYWSNTILQAAGVTVLPIILLILKKLLCL